MSSSDSVRMHTPTKDDAELALRFIAAYRQLQAVHTFHTIGVCDKYADLYMLARLVEAGFVYRLTTGGREKLRYVIKIIKAELKGKPEVESKKLFTDCHECGGYGQRHASDCGNYQEPSDWVTN